jgi:hypothetical protein
LLLTDYPLFFQELNDQLKINPGNISIARATVYHEDAGLCIERHVIELNLMQFNAPVVAIATKFSPDNFVALLAILFCVKVTNGHQPIVKCVIRKEKAKNWLDFALILSVGFINIMD